MRAFIKNYIASEKARREENGEEGGFSLIELIVVILILGILVAVAFPIFGAVENNAKVGALEAAAASGAVVAASAIAAGDPIQAALDASDLGQDYAYTDASGATPALSDVCVTAAAIGGGPLDGSTPATVQAGPGC